jgi:signal transduction histidine kinase
LTVSTHVVGDQADAQLEIRFSDTGCGIPADVLPRVFDPLFSTKSFGIGLGLAIVKEIVTAHGGEVAVESTLGQGSTFSIALPTCQA